MRRMSKWLPYVLAVLIIAACCGGIELSHLFLPDYRDEVTEIEEEDDSAAFYLDYRVRDVLWPWNLYEEGAAGPVTDIEERERAVWIAWQLMDLFAGVDSWDAAIGEKLEVIPGNRQEDPAADRDAETRAAEPADGEMQADGYAEMQMDADAERMEDPDSLFDGDIYVLHDVSFRTRNGEKYVLNLAYTEDAVLYYSCVSDADRAASFEDNTAACEYLNSSIAEFRDILYTEGYGYVESDTGYASGNCFYDYLNYLEIFSSYWTEGDQMPDRQQDVFYRQLWLLESGTSSGVSSDGSIMSLEMYQGEERMVLFFGPGSGRFLGFAMQPEE